MFSFKVLYLFLVSVLLGANTAVHTTKYAIGPGRIMRDYTASNNLSATDYHLIDLPIHAVATATGSNTVKTTGSDGLPGAKYAAICIPNPLKRMGTGTGRTFLNIGSGSITDVFYHNIANPNGASGDIGFVKDCESGTGSSLLNNLATATGARAHFSTRTEWGELDFIKLGMSKDPTSGYRATLSVIVGE